ncbi:MAG: hypothetical protein MJZ05_02645 [Fibrobacter sp.]|nr:hypothetical protein [Fibrobacter sp.]
MRASVCKLLLVVISAVSFGFGTPMEPAKSTLFILLDGMNPSNMGLLEDYCNHYENSEIWGKTGVAKYLQENVANTKANIYSRSYKNPSAAPSAMISELAGHNNMLQTVNCREKQSIYDAQTHSIIQQDGEKMQLSSIVDEALGHWFADVLNESEMALPTKSSEMVSLQKTRNAWDGTAGKYIPKSQYSVEFANIDPFLYAWIKNFKNKNNKMPTLTDLKEARPDFLPTRYVFIANGMGGMVAREYIQSVDYNGDVDKILFADTPHEGTGFADHALLSKDKNFMKHDISGSFLATIIPLITFLYTFSDSKTVSKFYVPMIKNIMNIVNAGSNLVASNNMNDEYFGFYNEKDGALWYSSQDADKRDLLYNYIRGQANSAKIDTLIGRTQMLNAYGMLSSYDSPMYRIMYSYGMPTIGNGRRTRADYLFQKKYHVDKKRLNENIKTVYSKAISTFLLDTLGIKQDIVDAYIFQLNEYLRDKVKDLESLDLYARYLPSAADWALDLLQYVDTKHLSKQILEGASQFAVEKLVDFAVDYGVGALLEWIDLGGVIDDMPNWLVTFISAIAELAPQQVTEQFVSSFMSSYAPSYKGMEVGSEDCKLGDFSLNPLNILNTLDLAKNIYKLKDEDRFTAENCVATGHKDFAQRLVNYSVNFFDEGTYDVPSHSAYGGNVALFAATDVKRMAYPLHTMQQDDEYSDYNTFKAQLLVGGAVEANRKLIDQVMGSACDLVPKSFSPACKVAQLSVNTGIIVGQNVNTSVMFHNIDVLKKSAGLSLKSSVQGINDGSVKLHSGANRLFTYTDMDMLMFEKPYMNLQMVVHHSEEGDKYIPLMLKAVSGADHEVPEIVDYNSLEQVYRQKYIKNNGSDEGFEIESVYDHLSDVQNLKEKKLVTSEDYYSLSLRGDSFKKDENGTITRRITRYNLPNIVMQNFVEEYRFQIEDLRPDLLWSIALDFNMDVQIFFERNSDNTWNSYIERNGRDRVYIEQGEESPVNEMGLFVLRPMRLIELANSKITDDNKKFFPNKLQPEGPNLVTATLTNAMGMVAAQQFSFYFQATLPLLKEGWPTYLQTVSSLKDMYITASNQGDPYVFTSAEVCLIKSANGQYTPALNDCVPATVIPQTGSFDQNWYMEAHFGDELVKTLDDGEYIIQWKLKAKDVTGNVTPYNMNVSVILDKKKPDFELVFPEKQITNKIKDGSWAKIINKDNSSLRATRIFAIPEGSDDTIWVKKLNGTGVSEINLGWNLDMETLPQGKSTVYIQSMDYAEPSVKMGIILQDLYSSDADVANGAWRGLLGDDGVTFEPGINGVTLQKDIYIDSEDPSIDKNSIDVVALAFASPCSDCPTYTRPSSDETVVNASESVQLSFSLKGETSTAEHDSVRIQVMFIDTDRSLTKTFVAYHDFKVNSKYTFEEPSATRLTDGKYSVVVNLTDAAGNSSGNIDLHKIARIARTAPVVNSVMPAEPVYASAEDVDAATFTVSSSEIEVNRSDFTCYQKITNGLNASEWVFIGNVSADKMVAGKKVSTDYSLKSASIDIANGRYTAIVGCFDGAGNFSRSSEPFSVGFRYPVLTYPTAADGGIANDIIRISGIAPNPVVPDGNVQTAEYMIQWRSAGSTEWKTDGIQSTKKIASTMVNDLAIWDRSSLSAGTYELLLSVRGCREKENPKCSWVESEIETIKLVDIDEKQEKPTIRLSVPVDGLVPGGNEMGGITGELLGVNDGSEWTMDMKIYASDPYDATRMIVADQKYLDSMIISPFGGSATATLPQGVSIWQEGDLWTIKVNDVLVSNSLYDVPSLVMHYTHSGLEFVNAVAADKEVFYNADDPNHFAPELDVGYGRKPAYNYTSEWKLDGKKDFELKFKSSEPFIIDLSSVKDVNSKLYCGSSGNLCSKYFPMLLSSIQNEKLTDFPFSEVYVDINSFKMDFPWNGLITGGMYPSTPKVKVVAIATEKQPGSRVVTAEVPMLLAVGAPEIISNYSEDDIGQFVVSTEDNQQNELLRLSEIGYEFGLAGRNANVTVTVKNSDGRVIATLMNSQPCYASAKKNAHVVTWNGISDGNFAKVDAGRYYFEVTAIDEDGNKAVPRIYKFDIIHAGHLIAASNGRDPNSSAAELKMEEASKENDEYRFVGRADYRLTMDAKARILPEGKRTFKYYWDWKGEQYPAFYRANRFSLGIRRHRKSFPVTLVTRLSSTQYYLDYKYDPQNKCLKNSITVRKVTFDEDEYGGSFVIPKLSVSSGDNTDHLIGWNEDENVQYDINFDAKVFAIEDYEFIKSKIGGESVSYCEAWGKQSETKEGFTVSAQSSDFNANYSTTDHPTIKLWDYNKIFKYKSADKKLDGNKGAVTDGCTPSEANDYVCEQTESFNPHENMLSVSIEHVDGEEFFGNDDFDCSHWFGNCDNHKSATEIFAKVTFTVNDKYWNPEFGYSNLANKYVRFDHTNKTLYDAIRGYYVQATSPNNSVKNYYDGEKWMYNKYYGMVTPFEVQRYFFNENELLKGNPLLFSDEVSTAAVKLVPSKYEFGFMGVDHEDKYDANKYGKKVDFIATAIGTLQNGTPIAEVITSDMKAKFVGSSSNIDAWLNAPIDFYVTARVPMKQAARYHSNQQVAFPYVAPDDKYIPDGMGHDVLCDITEDMSKFDDQSTHCFMYYHAASRIHYGKQDWTDEQWINHFGASDDVTYFNNPMYASPMNPMSSMNLFGDLSKAWGKNTQEMTYLTSKVEDLSYENSVWTIDMNSIRETDELNSDFENPLQSELHSELVLSQESVENGWHMNDDGIVENEGQVETLSVNYIRSNDHKPLDDNNLRADVPETIEKDRIAAQNESDIFKDDDWTKQFALSNLMIFDRNNNEHEFFNAKLSENSENVKVIRSSTVPAERVSEIVTLLGNVPGNATHWTLSYLSGNRMVPIASSATSELESRDSYKIVKEIDVNTLQGNTSFFLTYGLDDAGGDVYYKQLDVHIGELLDPSEKKLVKSMYGNVSVQFPANAFESKTDVTVRVASMGDYDYTVFDGLYPVGTIVEVLPSHVFNQSDKDLWPRVSIEVTKESLGNQDPLDVKIYKPNYKEKTIVPLEVQELGFYFAGDLVYTCGDSSGTICVKPKNDEWDAIRVSGKTPTFSVFMLMDEEQAALVKPSEDNKIVPDFACEDGKSYIETTLWAGLVNGYLNYPYPCIGESNYMLQLRKDGSAIAEHQGLADGGIIWNIRKTDIQTNVSYKDALDSRLSLYGSNGKSLQIAGPIVYTDKTLPMIEDASIEVADYELQKRITVDAVLSDSESGIDSVVMDFHWAGKKIERRVQTGSTTVAEEFLLTKKMLSECVGCKFEAVMTVYDYGHNNVKTTLSSENIYPFPKSLVLWYPLADGAGNIAKEATNTGVDLNLGMKNPWYYGTALFFSSITDVAKPKDAWSGIGSVPMSVEFKLRSNVSREGTEFSILGWNGSKNWLIGLENVRDLFFEYDGRKILFDNALVKRGVETHYVLTVDGRNIRLYRDGVLVENKTLFSEFIWDTKGKPIVGSVDNYKSINARISNIRFFRNELSEDEVMDLYRGPVDAVEANIEIVRAVDLQERNDIIVDQSCDLAGMSYLRSKSPDLSGSVNWNVYTVAGRYDLFVLARGYDGLTSSIEVFVDGSFRGIHDVKGSGVWLSQMIDDVTMNLSTGEHNITIKPVGYTGVAAFAIANSESHVPASMISWNEDEWSIPDPKVQVEVAYPSYSDKSWLRANFRLRNISDKELKDVKLRYYYSGEDYLVSARAFYPNVNMGVYADAGNVFYTELQLTETISAYGSPYYGNGPQIGAYRTNNNALWNYDDDPSFDRAAVNGNFHITDKVAVLDEDGNLISKFNCYDGAGPAKIKTPSVRALALDERGSSTDASVISMVVENVGDIPVHGFEIRYFIHDTEKPEFDVYNNPFAETVEMVDVGNDMYYVSFRYDDVILNPGEKSDYGSGVKFALHHANWQGWNASDDASHYGLTCDFAQADSIVVLDQKGNLLWGGVPYPANALLEIAGDDDYGDLIVISSGEVVVSVPSTGKYVLERVNAAGLTQKILYSGIWSAGEHSVAVERASLISGQYLVLRSGRTILSRIVIK